MSQVKVALLGGGIFATEAHLPALAKLGSKASLTAVWSRSSNSAKRAAAVWESLTGSQARAYSEAGSENLDLLLADPELHAVIVALPITSQPDVILRALRAGKHVLSEKPFAASVQEGERLLRICNDEFRSRGLIWRVAENWEVEPAHIYAGQEISKGRIGKVDSFSISSVLFVSNDGNKYFETEWRKSPQFQGGYLLDAGVHNAGVLRTVLPDTVTSLSAYTTLHNDHLAPLDWLSAIVRTETAHGQILIDYGAKSRRPVWELRVIGSGGEVFSEDVVHDGVDSIRVSITSSGKEDISIFPKSGVYEEQSRYLDAINGNIDVYGSLDGALEDVRLLEAALKSNGKEIVLV